MSNKRPKSVLVDKVVKLLDESAPSEVGNLRDESLKRLHYFLKYEMKLNKYEIIIKYNCQPKQILISVFGDSGVEYFVKPKDPILFIKLAEFMDVPDYVIRFMTREDYQEKKR